ncbi:hypothetical protein ACFST9_09140 [Hymenobacter monticola]|uniref:SMP-30/Gluconolactonase/LRE-like region domain-containing protein n=1 Tax=Hymenobacter monticola TaxID=1705399 RepID=A0ABY4B8X6_9BACT|nr:hypothetical protein [Hymenobacter monticola]UOE35629.1 hypothetical protein MTP16_08260 [Hymenobacter monticola]
MRRFSFVSSVLAAGLFGAPATSFIMAPPVPLAPANGGVVTTLAGGTHKNTDGSPYYGGFSDGRGGAAEFRVLKGLASDGRGTLYVADYRRIRKVTVATGEVSTLAGGKDAFGDADGVGTAARFGSLTGMVLDRQGNLYVADEENGLIRKVVVATGAVTTLAGGNKEAHGEQINGRGRRANFYKPSALALDNNGTLYVADAEANAIRKVVVATGEVTTLAGRGSHESRHHDGIGADATFDKPNGLALDGQGNLYVAETERIRKIVLATAEVSTLAGRDRYDDFNPMPEVLPHGPIAVDANGDVYFAAFRGVIKIALAARYMDMFVGSKTEGNADGIGAAATFGYVNGMTVDSRGTFYVTDGSNHSVRMIK